MCRIGRAGSMWATVLDGSITSSMQGQVIGYAEEGFDCRRREWVTGRNHLDCAGVSHHLNDLPPRIDHLELDDKTEYTPNQGR